MADIYIVEGSHGEYEDYRTWAIRAFAVEADAIAERDHLTKLADETEEAVRAARDKHAEREHERNEAQEMKAWDKLQKKLDQLCAAMSEQDKGDRSSWDRPKYEVMPVPFYGARRTPDDSAQRSDERQEGER